MRVVQISTYSFGGAGTAAWRLHQGLLDRGAEANFLCLYHRRDNLSGVQVVPPYRPNLLQKLSRRSARMMRSMLSRVSLADGQAVSPANYEMFTSPFCGHRLHRHPLVRNADVIHLHWVAGLIDYPSFFTNVKAPIVWTLHDMNPFKGCFHYAEEEKANVHRVAALDQHYKHVKREAYKGAPIKCVTAPSNWLTGLSSTSELLSDFPHQHVANGVDTEIYQAYSRDFARDVFSIPRRGKVLLFVSTAMENRRKGFDLLIEALRLIPRGENVTLVAVGEKPRTPLPGVFYLGPIGDERLMALAYAAADAFVIPTREDNFPNVILESMACGTPVIGTPVGGLPEVIRHGVNGLLAEAVTAEAIRDAIVMGLRVDFDREVIRRGVLERFQLPVLADNFTKLYKTLT